MSGETGSAPPAGGDAQGDKPADPSSKDGGDASGNVAGAKESFGASGPLPGGGTWTSTPDKDGAYSPNDDGHSVTMNFPDAHISGSAHGGDKQTPSHGGHDGGHKGSDGGQHQGAKGGADGKGTGSGKGDGPGKSDGAGKGDGPKANAKGDGGAMGDGPKGDEKPDDGKSAQGKPGDGKAGDSEAGDSRFGDRKADAGKTDASKSGDGKSGSGDKPSQPAGKGGGEGGDKDGKNGGRGSDVKPFNPGDLNKFEQALDGIFNPDAKEHPALKGVMNNLAKRGEALVNGFAQRVEDRGKILGELGKGHVGGAVAEGAKQLGGEAAGIAKGFGHSVKALGDALGDLAYYGTQPNEQGARQKIGSALVDVVLEGANVVVAVDGAAGLAKGGAAGFGGKAAMEVTEGAAAQAGKSGGGALENGAKGAAKAGENGAASTAKSAENGAGGATKSAENGAKPGGNGEGGGPPQKGPGASGDKPRPNNDVNDVAEFEARQAAFEAGKNMERGYKLPEGNPPEGSPPNPKPVPIEPVNARLDGKDLPPPRGPQLDKISAKTPEGAALRRAYGSKQGTEASKALQNNVRTRSEGAATRSVTNPNFGPASGRLLPEVGFKDGAIGHIDKAPGGSVAGSRTGDLGIAKQTVAPSEWPNLVGQKGGDALSGVKDLKVSGGYVKDKAGFRTESGGVNPEELRPFTPGLKR